MHLHGTRARLAVTALFLLGLMMAVLPEASARPYWTRSFFTYSFPTAQMAMATDSTGSPVIGYFYRYTNPNADGLPKISYTQFTGPAAANNIFYSHSGDSDNAGGVALAIDHDDRPRLVFHEEPSGELTYLYPVPLTSNFSGSGINGINPSLALDASDVAWVSFYDQDTGNLDYASIGGDHVWHTTTIASSIDPTWSSLALDSSGAPHITYYDSNDHELKYVSPTVPQTLVVDDSVGAGVYSVLWFDSNDVPYILYWDPTKGELKLASFNGVVETVQVLTINTPVTPTSIALALDSNDLPHITYRNPTADSLNYLATDGTSWTRQVIDGEGGIGAFSAITLDAGDNVTVAYQRGSGQTIYLANLADDSTAPTISGAPQGSANANGWYNQSVPIHWTCADEGGSGLASCGPDATIISEGVAQTALGTATDNAGNSTSAMSSPAVNIDKTKPTITGGPTTAPNTEGWYTSPVDISWDCADSLSQIDTCTEASTLSTEGANQSVSGTAVDKAGNTQHASATVSIDLTGPEISGAPNAAANGNGWYKAPVTITWACADDVSSITSCPDDQAVSTDGANQTTSGSATNGAGVTATATSKPFNLDQVPPAISGTPSGETGTNGWYTGPVTIDWDCSDELSTIDTCSSPSTLSSDGTNQSASGTATDKAGNTTTVASPAVNIDQTLPVVTYSGNQGTYTLDQTVNIRCTAADALSGLATTTCADITGPASDFVDGLNLFSASAADNAGNVSTASTSFTVDVTASGLCALTKEYVNNPRLGNQLCAPLQLAQMGEAMHNRRLTSSAMNSYILLVTTQRGRSLTITEANTLISLARSL